MANITLEDFQKLEIKIGTVTSCQKVEDTDKLLRLEIDFGDEKRTVLTGMAEIYDPDYFVGKQIPVLFNLEPRTIKGTESQGMILAVDTEENPVLLIPEEKVKNGSKVR